MVSRQGAKLAKVQKKGARAHRLCHSREGGNPRSFSHGATEEGCWFLVAGFRFNQQPTTTNVRPATGYRLPSFNRNGP